MKRDEKNLQTRQKIIDSALSEFGEKSYGEASLNTICAVGNISKGTIYHYFKDKDELYLLCVKECFDTLTAYLSDTVDQVSQPIEVALESYFEARIAFFSKNPRYLKLFCHTIMNPPAHLRALLNEIKGPFDALNLSILTKLLSRVKLRPDVSRQEIAEVFCEYQNFINTRHQAQAYNELILKEHEAQCSRSLKILLYGVIERGADL